MLIRVYRKIKIALSLFFLSSITLLFLLYIFLSSLQPDELLIGATSNSYKLPHYVFRFYIKLTDSLPPNYRTSYGLPAIQFLANGRTGDSKYDDACLEMIYYLIKNGADINERSKDKLGLTALHVTILNKDVQLAKFLIKNGADPNATASGERYTGMTPIRFAQELKKSKNDSRLKAIQSLLRNNGGHE